MISAVLFDFGDTLFRRRGGARAIIDAARELGAEANEADAAEVWSAIQDRARTAEELAKGRDLSASAHRAAWTALYRQADVLAPGMGEVLYEWEIAPERWVPFADTLPTLSALRDADVGLGVVSDTGWDIRPILARSGCLDWFGAVVLSYEYGVAKPAPSLFRAACETLAVQANETLMVGDNPLTDGGAAPAGLTALILPPVDPTANAQPRGLWPATRLALNHAP